MSRPLSIGIFVGAFPVASETFILRQITGLLDLGHDVHIFANTRGDDSVSHASVARYGLLSRTRFVDGPPESVLWEMPVRPVREQTWLPGSSFAIPNVARLAHAFPLLAACAAKAPALTRQVLDARDYGYRARSLSSGYRLAALLNTPRQFDLLHMHFGPVATAFRFTRELYHAPLVVSFHGYDFCTVPRKEGAEVYHPLWPVADCVIANSDYTRRRLLDLGCAEAQLTVLPVGLDPGEFAFRERRGQSSGPVRLLTVARLVEIKGLEFVLRALAALRGSGRELHYDVVGDGPLRQKLTALADELGLSDVVTFHGARNESEVREHFVRADIFVLTSVSIEGDAEGQGLVLQEAQACGLPVIATRHGAFPEGIAVENLAWLVPERDVKALAARLAQLTDARGEWPAMGRAGRAFVEQRYNIRALNARLVDTYREVITRFNA
jgi:colanic acid/amylovoran biosynthesis glycosyltransferase